METQYSFTIVVWIVYMYVNPEKKNPHERSSAVQKLKTNTNRSYQNPYVWNLPFTYIQIDNIMIFTHFQCYQLGFEMVMLVCTYSHTYIPHTDRQISALIRFGQLCGTDPQWSSSSLRPVIFVLHCFIRWIPSPSSSSSSSSVCASVSSV